MNINEEIKECEETLKIYGVTYEDVLKERYAEDFEAHDVVNFEAGKLAVLYRLKRC
jgi:hypothetical protein